MSDNENKKEQIIRKLKEQGCRITKQRLLLIDIILKNECCSCKDIYYRAIKEDAKIGIATVYRVVNTLEEIGAISRQNMYKVEHSRENREEDACVLVMEDYTVHHISQQKWSDVIWAGLSACGYLEDNKVISIRINPEKCCEIKY